MEVLRSYRDPSAALRATDPYPNSALCLEFIVFSGCRTGEARLATWDHIDRRNLIWTVPPENHKMGNHTDKPIFRPISKPMLAVLGEMERRYPDHAADAPIFPSPQVGRHGGFSPYNRMTVAGLVRKLDWPATFTAHGFRSTFTDWCRANGYEKHLYDAQTGHVVGNQVAQAYGRDQLVDQRRPMMEAWGQYCSQPTPEPIVEGTNIESFAHFRRKA
jgi:integrase